MASLENINTKLRKKLLTQEKKVYTPAFLVWQDIKKEEYICSMNKGLMRQPSQLNYQAIQNQLNKEIDLQLQQYLALADLGFTDTEIEITNKLLTKNNTQSIVKSPKYNAEIDLDTELDTELEISEDTEWNLVERRINAERRKLIRRTIATGKYYLDKELKFLPERRKIIRRACDRASNWRRGFWRDQQRKRIKADFNALEEQKKDNLWFSNKRVLIARKRAMEQKVILAQSDKTEKTRLTNAIAHNYGLDINVPAEAILNLFKSSRVNKTKAIFTTHGGKENNQNKQVRKMQFYGKNKY